MEAKFQNLMELKKRKGAGAELKQLSEEERKEEEGDFGCVGCGIYRIIGWPLRRIKVWVMRGQLTNLTII